MGQPQHIVILSELQNDKFIPGGRVGQLALLHQGCEQMLLLVCPVDISGDTHFVLVSFTLSLYNIDRLFSSVLFSSLSLTLMFVRC